MAKDLTTTEFWDNFWKSRTSATELLPDTRLHYDRAFIEIFRRHLKLGPQHRVFEAGCAPGKWLAYFHKAYGCRVTGCDSSPAGVRFLRQNLQEQSVPADIYEGDFLEIDTDNFRSNVVMSFGLIEHFNDPGPIIQKHVELVKPGGLLILEVPNFRGINHWLQSEELLSVHNLNVMKKEFFIRIASIHHLRPLFLKYFGGFEPGNLDTRKKPIVRRIFYKGLAVASKLPGADALNSALWSGFLMGIFEKSDPTGRSESLSRR